MSVNGIKTEKVRINETEYEIRIVPVHPATDNNPSTPNTSVVNPYVPDEFKRQVPAITELPRWEDGAID